MIKRKEAIRKINTLHCTYDDENNTCSYCQHVRNVITQVYDDFFDKLIETQPLDKLVELIE